MAEPSRRLDDEEQNTRPVYDSSGTAPSSPKPDLKALEGGGEITEPNSASSSSTSPSKLSYSSPADTEKSFYKPSPSSSSTSPGRIRFKVLGTRRRKIVTGGVITALVGGSVAVFTIVSGPLQLVHLSQVLQRPFEKQQSDSSNRLGRLFRYAKSGEFGETRVGLLGSHYFGTTIDSLEKIGVTIKTNSVGRPTETSFEIDKLKTVWPELEGMNNDQIKSFLADKMGVDASEIKGGGGLFSLDQSEYNLKALGLQAKSTAALLDNGDIVTGIKGRVLAKYFGEPSLFHPFERLQANKINQIVNTAEQKKALDQAETEREGAVVDPAETEGAGFAKSIEDANGGAKSILAGLALVGGACLVRNTAGDIIKVNFYSAVAPSALNAIDAIAVGDQAQTGEDLTSEQAGVYSQSHNNAAGQTLWQGQALQALASNNGAAVKGLTDIPVEYKQAFSDKTTAASIEATANQALSYIPFPGGPSTLCSTPVQLGAAITALAITAVIEGFSGGFATPAVAAAWAADEATQNVVTGTALHFIDKFILSQTTLKLAANAFQGPVGGNLLAYGARAGANLTAIAGGGIALAGSNASTFISAADQQQWQSSSIANRFFNTKDSRSLIGSFIDKVSPSFIQNLSKIGGLFTNFGSVFSHAFSIFSPKAEAASQYNWGFPQYGLPNSMLNDPNLANPYANASYVGKYLTQNCKDSQGNIGSGFGVCAGLASRIMSCFGNSLTYDPTAKIWDVVPHNEVNPQESSYISSNCNDVNDPMWRRVVMYVSDTNTMKAAACYQGDGQSCSDLGVQTAGGS